MSSEPSEESDKGRNRPSNFAELVAAEFEKAHHWMMAEKAVVAVKKAKEAFQNATRVRLGHGDTIETLSKELDGLSDRTISQVQHWRDRS